jgi:predicted dienelactone hydrolase
METVGKNHLSCSGDRLISSCIKFNRMASIGSSMGVTVAIALSSIFTGILATVCSSPAHSAEQIRFWYPPVGEFTIHVSDLDKFAKEGKVTQRLEIYLGQISLQQQAQFREALSTRYNINHVTISQFTYSPIGEILLRRLGRILQITPKENGFSALRAALILSAQSKEGLTVLNVLQQYPVPVIYLDLPRGLQAYAEASQLIYKKEQAITAIEKQAISESLSNQNENIALVNSAIDLRLAGNVKWTKEQFTYLQRDRNAKISTDLYLPTGLTTPAPLIVISHGVASNPDTFQYLSQHLASHGFAVAALEHPQTGSRDFATFLSGLNKAPESEDAVQRPKDISYLLDDLEQKLKANPQWRDRFTTEQVGLIGHSLGGYTVLTLSGGQLNFKQINEECSTSEPNVSSFNMSKILQCRISSLNGKNEQNINLRDRRVKAVLAINPLGGSTLLGKEGIQNIKIPIAIFASGDDLLTPAVPEQFFPFVWLTSSHKYLVTFPKGTHFSFLERSDRGVLVVPEAILGEKPEFTHPYAKALSLAFFQSHLNNRPEFTTYLNNNYVQAIGNSQFPATLTTNFSEDQLWRSLEASP